MFVTGPQTKFTSALHVKSSSLAITPVWSNLIVYAHTHTHTLIFIPFPNVLLYITFEIMKRYSNIFPCFIQVYSALGSSNWNWDHFNVPSYESVKWKCIIIKTTVKSKIMTHIKLNIFYIGKCLPNYTGFFIKLSDD